MTNTVSKSISIVSKDISVVVQGSVVPVITLSCLKSIQQVLPEAEIILSTWTGEDISCLPCDRLVISTPPEAICVQRSESKTLYNNTNRMIYGVQEGLKKVTRPYTLKIRTDIILQDTDFLQYWGMYPKRSEQNQLFTHRILNYYLFAPQFNFRQGVKIPTLFHPSDWMFFGLTSDIKKLFDIPLQPDPDYSLWWNNHSKPNYQIDPWPGAIFRYSPEQYLFYQALHQQFPEITFDSYFDITRKKEKLSRAIMVNNFVILDYRQWHIQMPKYQHIIGTFPYGQTSHVNWQEDYKTYCVPSFKISWKEICFKYLKLNLGEILKTRKIEFEKWFVSTFFLSCYKKHLQKKYVKSPEKLKQKLAALRPVKRLCVYSEDFKQ